MDKILQSDKFVFFKNIFYSEQILIFILLIILAGSHSVFSQVQMTKTLPKPKFYLIGVEDLSFPVSPKNYDDSFLVMSYGKRIEKWIVQNPEYYNLKIQNPTGNVFFNYLDFEKLNNEQRVVFKSIIKQITPAIRPQRIKLLNDFESKFQNEKGTNHDFTNEATQVYFLNKIDVEFLINELNK